MNDCQVLDNRLQSADDVGMDRFTMSKLIRKAWFAGLPTDLRAAIVQHGQVRVVKDSIVYAVGDPPNGLFAVLSGTVQISFTSSTGKPTLLIVARLGDWFGETSFFDRGTRYSDALALGRVSLLHLDERAFLAITRDRPERYAAFVRLLCEHHRLAMDHIASLGALPVAARLAQRLLFFAKNDAENAPCRIVRFSQEQLASTVGVSRQALSAHLKNLEQQHLIEIGYREIRLRNVPALARLVRAP